MFNIALGWAYLISAVASPGGKLMALIFEVEGLRTTPPYQKVLFSIFANYWIPALLIYLLLRLIRAQTFLKPDATVHVLLGIANTILSLYVSLRVLTSTIEGGGATFALASLGAYIVTPSRWTIVAGTIWLAIRSLRIRLKNSPPTAILHTPLLKTKSGVFALVMLIPPIAFFGWLYLTNAENLRAASVAKNVKNARFEELCKTIKIQINKT